jgi:hypothetical protein
VIRVVIRQSALVLGLVIVPGVVLGLVGATALHTADVEVSAVYLVGMCIVALALFRLGRYTLADLEAPARVRHGSVPRPLERPALLLPIERRLSAATREGRLFVVGLQPMLWDLARERIRLHNGLDLDVLRAHQPTVARDLIGDEVWQWLTTSDPDAPPPSPRTVAQLVRAVGRL